MTAEEKEKLSAIAAEEQRQDQELLKQGKVLALKSFSYQREYDRIVAKGEVKNITDQPMTSVVPNVSFYAADRKRIRSAKGTMAILPLKPGQSATFDASADYHPLMRYSNVTFSTAEGKPLPAGEYPK